MNQIIVKTASFVCGQGLQMEILLKAKQAANSQFDFLNLDNQLNPYYKHLQPLIRARELDPLEFLASAATAADAASQSTGKNTDQTTTTTTTTQQQQRTHVAN